MSLYQSTSQQGDPTVSDVFKYLTDASYAKERKTFGSGTAAAYEIGALDARLTLTANESGTAGNYITIAVVDPGEINHTLRVEVTYSEDPTATNQINVVVYPGTDGTGTIDSITTAVRDAINADTVAKLHVTASIENGSGASVIATVAETNLTGGAAGGVHKIGEVVSTNSVTGMTGQYVVGGANGTGTIIGILYNAIDTTETEQEGLVVVNGEATVLYKNLILPSNAVEATVKAALWALGIKAI